MIIENNQINRIAKYACSILAITGLLLCGCSDEVPAQEESQIESESVEVVPSATNEEIVPTHETVSIDEPEPDAPETMEVHFIDVGEGDATLIKCGGDAMLIDAGDPTMGTTVRGYLKKQGVDSLKYLILTHSDKDHIGGAPSVISNMDVENLFMCRFEKTNEVYQSLINEIDFKSMTWSTPDVGSEYTLGDAQITILAPNKEYDNPNDSSIALIVRHGDNSFLFTGDAEAPAEADILANGLDISADVYKVGHHGSSTASSQDFLDKVAPSIAIISCAKDNDYGHPHIETVEKLKDRGVALYRTDEQGTIVAVSDGKEITFDKEPTDNWEPGTALNAESASSQVKQAIAETTQAVEPESSVEESSEEPEFVVYEPSPEAEVPDRSLPDTTGEITYVANTNTHKFHRPTCSSVSDMKAKNRWDTTLTREELIAQGYEPCKRCNP